MPVSKNRRFAKIANDVTADGTLTAAAISPDVDLGGGITVYDSTGLLPYVGNEAGDQAFVNSNNRLYIWEGAGWYNVALINRSPSILSVTDAEGFASPFTLADDGSTPTIVTITAADSDGDPITYTVTKGSGFDSIATVSQDSSVFTITPLSEDSVGVAISGTLTFNVSDGVNISSSVSTFRTDFLIPWTAVPGSFSLDSVYSLGDASLVPADLVFKPDGTKLILGNANDAGLNEYSLGTPWDLSSLSYVRSYSVQSKLLSVGDNRFEGIHIEPDGTKMYVNSRNGKVVQYTLNNAWQLDDVMDDSITFTGFNSRINDLRSITMNRKGTKLFGVSNTDPDDPVLSANLSTPFDLSTADSTSIDTFALSSQETVALGLAFNNVGTAMYTVGFSGDIHRYTLSTPYDLTTATFTDQYNTGGPGPTYAIAFEDSAGTKVYVVDYGEDDIYVYSTGL